MKQLVKKNKILYYEITRTNKNEYRLIVEDNYIKVIAHDYADDKDIESVLSKKFISLYYKTHPELKNRVVHYKGIPYEAVCKKGKKDVVVIEDDTIIITAIKDESRYYQAVLRRFYKRSIEEELTKIIYDAQNDFNEIKFPKIIVKFMRDYFGYYYKNENKIIISSILGKYHPKFVKVVLYHELSHTLEISHCDRFFEILEGKLPGAVKLDNFMKYDHYNDFL